jgi:hypothetical protein
MSSQVLNSNTTGVPTSSPVAESVVSNTTDQIPRHVNVWDYLVSYNDEKLLLSLTAERTRINVLDYLTIPERDTAIDGVNPFAYQESNDAWTIKVT